MSEYLSDDHRVFYAGNYLGETGKLATTSSLLEGLLMADSRDSPSKCLSSPSGRKRLSRLLVWAARQLTLLGQRYLELNRSQLMVETIFNSTPVDC